MGNPNIIKGSWSPEEDALVVELVEEYGPRRWSAIAQNLQGRSGKQCRERWHNHLDPTINRGPWTEEEDMLLIEKHEEMGNKWAEISKFFEGRTDNMLKNHWNSTIRRRVHGASNSRSKKNQAKQKKAASRKKSSRVPTVPEKKEELPVVKSSRNEEITVETEGQVDTLHWMNHCILAENSSDYLPYTTEQISIPEVPSFDLEFQEAPHEGPDLFSPSLGDFSPLFAQPGLLGKRATDEFDYDYNTSDNWVKRMCHSAYHEHVGFSPSTLFGSCTLVDKDSFSSPLSPPL